MRVPEGTEFCIGCPYIPEGVTAQVDTITPTTMSEYGGFVITREAPDLVEDFVSNLMNVTSTAIASTNPNVDIGDHVSFKVEKDGRTEEEIANAFRSCQEPKRNLFVRALGQKGTCQAVKIR